MEIFKKDNKQMEQIFYINIVGQTVEYMVKKGDIDGQEHIYIGFYLTLLKIGNLFLYTYIDS